VCFCVFCLCSALIHYAHTYTSHVSDAPFISLAKKQCKPTASCIPRLKLQLMPWCSAVDLCRSESELDPVTLHNMALVHMDKSPGAGFKKLNFLLSSGTFPPETFANLLLLYCAPQHGFLDLAADVMAENPEYCSTLLSRVSCVQWLLLVLSAAGLCMALHFQGGLQHYDGQQSRAAHKNVLFPTDMLCRHVCAVSASAGRQC